MESGLIPDQKNVFTDSGVTILHLCDYSYQQYEPTAEPSSHEAIRQEETRVVSR